MKDDFEIVGMRGTREMRPAAVRAARVKPPILSVVVFALILTGCLACELVMTKDPTYMDLANYTHPPDSEFLFGTDGMGRDIFSMVWYGGRVSLFIGVVSTVVSTAIAIVFGAVSGSAPARVDALMMRAVEILLSVPSLLVIVLVQAALGEANVLSLSFVIGITSWTSVAKVVRSEVRQMRSREFLVAAKCMGGGFFYLLRRHMTPNFVSSIMFMVVMNVRGAIVAESTLSFMGIGLPLETVSWGSMLSLAESALMTGAWWIVVIPGAFLTVTLLCITSFGNFLRKRLNRGQSNL